MTEAVSANDTLVLTDISDGVALMTMNRPEAYNALSRAMTAAIIDTLASLSSNEEVRVIVLTGKGKAFTAGVDLKELSEGGGVLDSENLGDDAPLVTAFAGCSKPIIGAVNGFAVTGGFELALACDFLYAARSAKFADTHARVGIVPGWGITQKLPRIVGINRAREISFTGNYFSADQALEWGLVNRVCDDDELVPQALATARQIAETLPEALTEVRHMINAGWDTTLADGLALEGRRSKAFNDQVDFGQMNARLEQLKSRGRKQ
jgi:enoyl-CoA hydratase